MTKAYGIVSEVPGVQKEKAVRFEGISSGAEAL
jgi:hypothetical protein